MAIALAALFVVLTAARLALAAFYQTKPSPLEAVTILQPILSGDPLLEATLQANLDAHPEAQFLWLIDEDDVEARRIVGSAKHARLRVMTVPAPKDGENPKMAKLIRALAMIDTPRLLVLDDDTFLPANAVLPDASLATGLPVFVAKGSVYERLVGGFVNGSALLTYLPAARLGLQRTINGMIYALRTNELRMLGGFEAAGHEITDDYAVARLYLRSELPITQAVWPAMVAMTIRSLGHYARVMRRWMIFASHYLRGNVSPATLCWVVLPGLLPLAGLLIAGPPWLGLLAAKAAANRWLLWRKLGVQSSIADVIFEVVADLLTPIWATLAYVRPSRMTWRSRRVTLDRGTIRYK